MNTDAKLSIRMPGKVVIVDNISNLPTIGIISTLYVVRNGGEAKFYEYHNGEYRLLLDGVPEGVEDLLNDHIQRTIYDGEVHGLKYEDSKLKIKDDDGEWIEFEGGDEGGDGGVIIVERRRDLPNVGQNGIIYIVKKDETNEHRSSLYIYDNGAYVMLASFVAEGSIQEYRQVTKLGVQSPKEYELSIPRTSNFLRAPIEVLLFNAGEQDIQVEAEFDNESQGHFILNNKFEFTDDGFKLSDYIELQGEVTEEWEEHEVSEVELDTSMKITKLDIL